MESKASRRLFPQGLFYPYKKRKVLSSPGLKQRVRPACPSRKVQAFFIRSSYLLGWPVKFLVQARYISGVVEGGFLKQRQFAALCGISEGLISRLAKRGQIIKSPAGDISLDNPVNAAYLQRHRAKAASLAITARASAEIRRRTATATASAPEYADEEEPVSFLAVLGRWNAGERLVVRYGFDSEGSEVFMEIGAGLPEAVAINLESESIVSTSSGRVIPSRFISSDAILD